MIDPLDVRGLELIRKIDNSITNEVITIPLKQNDFGEYRGPIVMRKALTLIGGGEKTPIFGKGCPAIIILSSNVKLKNIEVADSFDVLHGVSILALSGTNPVLENVVIRGQKNDIHPEQLINLGDFFPDQKSSSYLEVEIPDSCEINCFSSSAKWLDVYPRSLSTSGKHILQMTCDTRWLGADTFAVGGIEISSENFVQQLWVMLHVLPASPRKLFTEPIALIVEKNQRIRFENGFLIGRSRFPGNSAALTIADRQAIILRDAVNGVWTIYQPWKTALPTLVNDHALLHGQRMPLRDGSVLRIGSFELKVEQYKQEDGFSINKSVLNVGDVGEQLNDKGFTINYLGKMDMHAKIRAVVPWLQVRPDHLDFPIDNGKEVTISLTPAASALSYTKFLERSVILIQSKSDTWSLDVNLDISVESVRPRADTSLIKFENVTDLTKAQSFFTLYNDGTKDWKPRIQLENEWLIVEPDEIVVPAGKSVNLSFKLDKEVCGFSSPSQLKSHAVFEGDNASLRIEILVELRLSQPEPTVNHSLLDFEELYDFSQLIPKPFVVQNHGNKEWMAQVKSNVSWLDIVGNPNLVIPARGQKAVLVQLNSQLPTGTSYAANAIQIGGEGRDLYIAVKARLNHPTAQSQAPSLAPDALVDSNKPSYKPMFLSFEPAVLDFGDIVKRGIRQGNINVLVFSNSEWRARISSHNDWLVLKSETLSGNANSATELQVELNEKVHKLENGIHWSEIMFSVEAGKQFILPVRIEKG